eukprot:TRINITY_DN18120_c0_g2_i1.p1 TRINITY_DN18120_c0_g2~~TRINITY_DN18120_c0_g2_i1.p1  ORF type:complete len:348 (+),score=44.82 TRINITY_DN18120_c0_g2_i1:33-1046(+)
MADVHTGSCTGIAALARGGRLDALASAAAPLPPQVAALLAVQMGCEDAESFRVLPSFAALVAALGFPRTLTATRMSRQPTLELPPAHARLPTRLVATSACDVGGALGEEAPGTELERSLWRTYVDHGIHALLTSDFLDCLAAYLSDLLAPLSDGSLAKGEDQGSEVARESGGELPVVLEIGAGSGVLAKELSLRLDGVARVVATDSRAGRIPAAPHVVSLHYEDALVRYSPAVVLVSWMPPGADWTAAIRALEPRCQAYLLIGEPDGDTCGDGWATWGVLPANCGDYGLDEDAPPPYAEDGWERCDMEEASALQICRFDSIEARGFSRTVCFRPSAQ